MKKVLLMNVLYKPNIGGVENSISEITNVLYDAGYQVDIFCSNRNNEDEEILSFFENNKDCNIYRYKYDFSKFSFFKNIFYSSKLLKNLNKENKYNHIISRSYFLTIVSWFSCIENVNYIVPEVSYYSNKGSSLEHSTMNSIVKFVKNKLQFAAFIVAKDVYVFSESMVEQVKKSSLGFISPKIVEPGINFKKFSIPTTTEKKNLRKIYNISENRTVLLALGRFSEIKQFNLAILAMKYLSEQYLLVIVGSGPELENYKNLINDNKLQEKILIFESTNNPEYFYKSSDIFLMTSRYESFGQTILEAAMSGLKIVAFNRKSGVNTNVKNMLLGCQDVYFVSNQSSVELAKSITLVSENTISDKFIYFNNRRVIKNRYSWSKLVSKLGISV
ncbi:glycosyltransferase [Psychrobacter sp. T6-1]|uniref:glycosyltransferase n=1 Tax=Psychrobacter sp. T6-1 TaxID=3457447 RepID=UPI003FD55BAC